MQMKWKEENCHYYCPQTKFAKVMFLQVSVCSQRGDVHGGGHVWWGTCMVGGHVWQGVCMAGGMCGNGACMSCTCPPSRHYEIRSMSGRYASYWNAFLFTRINPVLYI